MKPQRTDQVDVTGFDFCELAELDAWEGYEFWSAQLEAYMEPLDEGGGPGRFGFIQLERKAGQTDVLPF